MMPLLVVVKALFKDTQPPYSQTLPAMLVLEFKVTLAVLVLLPRVSAVRVDAKL